MMNRTFGPFLSANTLRTILAEQPVAVVPVDCRFNLLSPHTGFQAYVAGHIPGARYAHLDKDLARHPGPAEGRHPLPDLDDFSCFLGASGIGPSSIVVAYDDASGAIAARLWWLLGEVGHRNRAVLDGGLQAWVAENYPLEARMPAPGPTEYTIRPSINPTVLATGDVENFLQGGGKLLDARSPVRFAGLEEPIDPVAGHIPGATNLPFTSLLDSQGQLQSGNGLVAMLEAAMAGGAGADVAVMCGSGVTACLLAAAFEAAGREQPRLYPGSWSEWIRDPGRPIAADQAKP